MHMKNIGAKREKKRINRLHRKEIKRKKLTAAEEKFNDLPRLEASAQFASLLSEENIPMLIPFTVVNYER